jgi:hypothetical protein
LHEVDEINLLMTSGEKLFSDMAFWKMLSQVRRRLSIKILLLDPDSPAATRRERTAYRDKKTNFLGQEISENIGTIKRMAKHFRNSASPLKIQCKLYSERPSFRMTFIGKDRLLVASYVEDRRTGFDTLFFDVSGDQEGGLFDGFKREFERIESTAKRLTV